MKPPVVMVTSTDWHRERAQLTFLINETNKQEIGEATEGNFYSRPNGNAQATTQDATDSL